MIGVGGMERHGVRVLVCVLAMAPVLLSGPPAGAAPTAAVTLNPTPPTPFAPFSVSVASQGCTPNASLEARVIHSSVGGFDPWFSPQQTVPVTADAAGNAATTVNFAAAYPGEWDVDPPCGSTFSFIVPRPANMTMTARTEPTTPIVGQPFRLVMTGHGCPGTKVRWFLGGPPDPVATGPATLDTNGDWSAEATVALPLDSPPVMIVTASCDFPDAAILYGILPFAAQEPTTTTTSTVPPADQPPAPVAVTPSFTG